MQQINAQCRSAVPDELGLALQQAAAVCGGHPLRFVGFAEWRGVVEISALPADSRCGVFFHGSSGGRNDQITDSIAAAIKSSNAITVPYSCWLPALC